MRIMKCLVGVAAVGLLAGCGTSDSCTDTCPRAGETRCFGQILQRCVEDDKGCLHWESLMDCTAIGSSCDGSGDTATCAADCEDACQPAGVKRCQGDVLQTCAEAGSGCLDWSDTVDCADAGLACDPASGQCQAGCRDECDPPGATRCEQDVVQSCLLDAQDCYHWRDLVDCSNSGQVCSQTTGEAECIEPCDDVCQPEDATRCDGNWIQTCSGGDDGCLDWIDTTDCSQEDLACDDSGDAAVCADTCPDACDAVGATDCDGTVVVVCSATADPDCLQWMPADDCWEHQPPQWCIYSEQQGAAACQDPPTCEHECLFVGETGCADHVLRECVLGGDGCLDWSPLEDCAAGGQVCHHNGDTAACADAADVPHASRILNGGFEMDVPGTAGSSISHWEYSHEVIQGMVVSNQVVVNETSCFAGDQAARLAMTVTYDYCNWPDHHHADARHWLEVAAARTTLAGYVTFWVGGVDYTQPSRYYWRLNARIGDGQAEERIKLRCRSWRADEGCVDRDGTRDWYDYYEEQAIGADGQTWQRYTVAIPAAMDRSNLIVTIEHRLETWDCQQGLSALSVDEVTFSDAAGNPLD